MNHRHSIAVISLCLTGQLSGCGFIAAPIVGTATAAAQLSVKAGDTGIYYGKQAAGGVAAAANTVVDAAMQGLRPATSEEATTLHERFSER